MTVSSDQQKSDSPDANSSSGQANRSSEQLGAEATSQSDEAIQDAGNNNRNGEDEDDSDEAEEDDSDEGEESVTKRLAKKYVDANGDILVLNVDKKGYKSLGVSLAGNRDPSVMSVFVCGLRPDGAAARDGRLRISDELLEVNSHVLLGKSHLNAAPLINGCRTKSVRLVIVRRPTNIESMAVKPISPPKSVPIDYAPENLKQPDLSASTKELEALIDGSAPVASDADGEQQAAGPYGVELQCVLPKGKQGLGFAIMERSLSDEPGIYVKHITEGGPAHREGTLRTGDRLLQANEFNLAEATYDEALDKLRSMAGQVSLTVARKFEGSGQRPQQQQQQSEPQPQALKPKKEVRIATPAEEAAAAAAAAATVPSDQPEQEPEPELEPEPDDGDTNLATRKILRGRETVIEIDKGEGSLGLGIVGGSDTGMKSVLVYEISDTGAAAKDQRLAEGDQLVSLDDKGLSAMTHEEAKATLLQAGKKVKLKVARSGKGISESQLYDQETIELAKKPSRGLGFSIAGRPRDQGVLVSDIIRGGAAESDGRLQPGDRLLEIGGSDVRTASHADVATQLKAAQGKVALLIGRLRHVGASSKVKRKTGGL